MVLERRIELTCDLMDLAYRRSWAACNTQFLLDEPYIRRAISELRRSREALLDSARVLVENEDPDEDDERGEEE